MNKTISNNSQKKESHMNTYLTAEQKSNVKFGLLIGLSSFILMMIDYFAFRNRPQSSGYVEGAGALLVFALGIIVGIRQRRKTHANSLLTFKQGLGTGLIISLWAGVFYSLLSCSYIVFINPHYVDEMLLRETYKLPHDVTAAESVGARLIAEISYRPEFQLAGKFLSSLFLGLIISSIYSFLNLKKQRD